MQVRTQDLVLYGALGIGAYLLYTLLKPVLDAGSTAVAAVGQAINAGEQGVANLWVSLTAAPPMNIQGSAQLPGGATLPLSSLVIRTDGAGNVFTNLNGTTYQMQPWVLSNGVPVYPLVAVGT